MAMRRSYGDEEACGSGGAQMSDDFGVRDMEPTKNDSEKDSVLRGPHIVEEGMRELGIDMSKVHLPELSYEELKELAWQDRLEERGLL